MQSEALRHARRVAIFIVGCALLLSGIVMLVIPGPGWLVIFAGLSVLAIEFVWARHLLEKLKNKGAQLKRRVFKAGKKED